MGKFINSKTWKYVRNQRALTMSLLYLILSVAASLDRYLGMNLLKVRSIIEWFDAPGEILYCVYPGNFLFNYYPRDLFGYAVFIFSNTLFWTVISFSVVKICGRFMKIRF